MFQIIVILLLLFIVLAGVQQWLGGGRKTEYQEPNDPDNRQSFTPRPEDQASIDAVDDAVRELGRKVTAKAAQKDMRGAREVVDGLSDGRSYPCEFRSVDVNGIPAEWVIGPASDHARRLLYIHGGGFKLGSPKSHRTITSKFAETTGCTVLAIDYRLIPEFRMQDAVEDSRKAYQWMLDNGPDGPGRARQLFISGDSAGGNLTLSLIAWLRDQNLPAANAVVVFSPLTDATLSSRSLQENEATDIMLQSLLGPLNKLPAMVRIWALALASRIRPANPVYSPLLGNLSGLPPTLLQASETEMLLDDSTRYFNKAHAAGSPVKLQTWDNAVHVWQLFDPELPQARQAWREIEKFIAQHSSPDL